MNRNFKNRRMKYLIFCLFLCCSSQLAFSQGTWTNYTPFNSGVKSTIRALETDHLNRIWIGYSWDGYGISMYNGTSWTTIDTTNGLSENRVNVIFEDHNHNMWVGTQNGLCKFDGNNWVTYTTNDGLIYNYVISIYEDANNNLWFGTVNGLSKYDGFNWSNYSVSDGLTNNYIFGITQDNQDNMWFAYGLDPSGVTKFDGSNWTTYTTSDGLISNQVNTILCDHFGNLWFGCYGFSAGISMFDGITWTSYPAGSGPACNNVWASMEDSHNRLWFSTSCHGGTSMYDFLNWTIYDTTNCDIVSNNIIKMKEDLSGNIWFGGYDGLSKYSQQSSGLYENSITNTTNISIYPNPCTGKFSVLGNSDIKSIEIYNVLGEKTYVISNFKQQKSNDIDLSGFPKGIYFVKIYDELNFYTQKIVKQ